jgi:L-fuculose-phosphate aldolase
VTMTMHEQVLQAAKDMLRLGLTAGTSGNISGRLENDHVVITPSSVSYEDMTLEDLVVIDLDANVIDGQRHASSEKALHLECYKLYDEVKSVIHSHPVYATMFACARQPIPAAIDEFAIYVGGDVVCAEYAMSGTPDLGVNAAAQLEKVGTTLLASHGMVTVGPNPAKTLHQAGVVERSAQIIWGARSLGEVAALPEDVNKNFGGLYRYLRKNPQP